VYQEIYAVTSNKIDDYGTVIGTSTKHFMKNATKVDNYAWLQQLCSSALLSYSNAISQSDLQELKQTSKADYLIA
jgi:hypothetical protein